jgi:hypothetical protein
MVYTINIPLAMDLISNSQGLIEANFNELNTQFGVDHSSLVSPATGFHKIIHFTNQGADLVSAEGQLYTKTGTGPNGVATEQLKYAPSTGAADNPPFPLSVLPVRACAQLIPGGSPALVGAYNVNTPIRNGVGDYTVTLTNIPATMMVFPVLSIAAPGNAWLYWFASISQTSLRIITGKISPFNATDPTKIYITVFGG